MKTIRQIMRDEHCGSAEATMIQNKEAQSSLALAADYAVGDEVHLVIKGITNNREYNGAGEILSITGNYAKVRYRQPWARWHNCMREMMVDLRTCKKIRRWLRHNDRGQR
jgi:hypothetical protein